MSQSPQRCVRCEVGCSSCQYRCGDIAWSRTSTPDFLHHDFDLASDLETFSLVRSGELQGNTHGEYTTSNFKPHPQYSGQFLDQRFSTDLPLDSDTDSTLLEHLERFPSYHSQTLLLSPYSQSSSFRDAPDQPFTPFSTDSTPNDSAESLSPPHRHPSQSTGALHERTQLSNLEYSAETLYRRRHRNHAFLEKGRRGAPKPTPPRLEALRPPGQIETARQAGGRGGGGGESPP